MIRKTFSGLMLTLLAAASLSAQAAPTADELVEKNIQAKGGREKLKAIQSVRMSGKMMMGQGMEAGLVMESLRPDKIRTDVTIQGMTISQAYDGKNGWKVAPFTGSTDPAPMTAEELKQAQRQVSGFDGFMGYKERGEKIEYLGKEDLEGTPVYKLRWTRGEDVSTVYLDAEHYLEVKVVGKSKVQDQEVEGVAVLGDYKEVGGVIFPHSMEMTSPAGPGKMTMTFDKIEVNPAISASRFAMPAKQPAKPEPPKS